MTRLRATLCLVVASLGACTANNSGAQASSPPRMTVKVLSVRAPHIISNKKQVIQVRVRFAGITMDPLHIGQKPVPGRGHMQVYLDHIPSIAYVFGTSKGVMVMATTSTFNFVLSPRLLKTTPGRHHVIVALARNDDRLYRVKSATFTLIIR